MRILIVEDETRLAELISKVLCREHFDTVVAHNGSVGLDEALTGSYDAIVLDRMLPGLDGLDLLTAMRENQVDTPVLMLTALGELPERVEGLNAGPTIISASLLRSRSDCPNQITHSPHRPPADRRDTAGWTGKYRPYGSHSHQG